MGDKRKIAVIPGDGIGKEVIPQAVRVMEAAGAGVALTYFDWGADRYLADKTTVPPARLVIRGCPPTFTLKKFCWACAARWICMRTSARCD
jgi:hypothetical protein